ncbi:uncharacterized protein K02A2.6-like [Trichonephila clavipes]|nr:uncharacterized protein K02A2.6-like [Trichonephila clavipes]
MTISDDSPTFDIDPNVSQRNRAEVEQLLSILISLLQTTNRYFVIPDAYHLPNEIRIVDAQVDEWGENGIVHPCSSPYASQVVVVKKKNWEIKSFCIDYRRLNRKLIKDNYPLPLIDHILDCLQNAKIFTTLDLTNGFFHVVVNETSRKFASFVIHNGDRCQLRCRPGHLIIVQTTRSVAKSPRVANQGDVNTHSVIHSVADSSSNITEDSLRREGLCILNLSRFSGLPLTFHVKTNGCVTQHSPTRFYSKDNLVALYFKYDEARRRFVEWAQNEIAVLNFHKRILFSDEAHFWFNGYVNKQNCRIWSEANPQVYVEPPLHPEKLTVWCALWAGGIIGPYFFKNDEGHDVTVNGDRYRALITNFSFLN